MAESDKIRHDDLVESGLMNPTIKNFEELIIVVEKADQSIVKFGADLNKSLQGITPNSVNNLEQIFNLSKQINEADKSKIATAEVLSALRLREIEEKNKLKVRYAEEAREEKEKAKRLKEQESHYGKLSAKYREAAKAAKDLAAQYGTESKQAKEAIKTAKGLNDQLKRIDASIGNHQRNVGNYSSAMSGLNKAFGLFGITLGGPAVVGGLKSSIEASVDAEKNANALRFALNNVAGEGEAAFTKLIEQSNKLQESGGVFSDDEIQKVQAQLVNFGLTSDEVEKLIPKILDLVTVQGVDLATATDTAIKGINGQTKGLKSVGLGFADTGDKAQNYQKVLDGLTKFEGAAANAATTTEGKYKVLMNRFDDLQEDIGGFLVNAGSDFLQFWDVLTGKIDLTTAQINTLTQAFRDELSPETDKFLQDISKMAGGEQVSMLSAAIGNTTRDIEALNKASSEGLIDSKKYLAEHTALNERLNALIKQRQQLLGVQPKSMNERINAAGESAGKTPVEKLKKDTEDLQAEQDRITAELYAKMEADNEALDKLIAEHNQHRLDLYNADLEAKKKAEQEKYDYEKALAEKAEQERKARNDKAIADFERVSQAISDGIDARIESQQEGLSRESGLIANETQVQAELFSRGLENNLATQERLQAENAAKQADLAEKKRKKDEAMQLAGLFLELVKEDGNVPKALAETLIAKGISEAIAGSFAEGVENFKGEGTGTSDSNIIRFSNGESVVTAAGTQDNPGLVSAMNDGRVDDYFREIYLPQFASSLRTNGESEQSGTLWQNALLIKELRELKQVVANKKETTVELSKTGDVITTTVEQGLKKIVVRKPRKF